MTSSGISCGGNGQLPATHCAGTLSRSFVEPPDMKNIYDGVPAALALNCACLKHSTR
jgi:hypothetical protein